MERDIVACSMLVRPACTFFCFCKVAFLAVLLVFLCDWLRSTKSAQSDFGGFPVASSSMTVESKCVLHTKLVVLASIESVLSGKWVFQGHFAVLQRLSHRQKRCFATEQLAE